MSYVVATWSILDKPRTLLHVLVEKNKSGKTTD